MKFLFAGLFTSLAIAATLNPLAANDRLIEVFKSPTCGCCQKWVEHLEENGFQVVARNVAPQIMTSIKRSAGIPRRLASCHTAKIGGYFIEGHVPAENIKQLMSEKPKAKGLAVPGMPVGSPGMEIGDKKEPYDVMIVRDGQISEIYATH